MMMKSCLFVSSERSVTPYKEHSRLVRIIEILINGSIECLKHTFSSVVNTIITILHSFLLLI